MDGDRARTQERPVRVHAAFGTFDASLSCSAGMRTLDVVNQLSSSVVMLRPTAAMPLGPPFGQGRLAIAKSSIMLVYELESFPAPGGKPRCRFWQAPVVLRVGHLVVLGSVHVPVGGDPLLRIHQSGPPFIALTSAVLRLPEDELEIPFLAVNRLSIVAAQKLADSDASPERSPAGVIAESVEP